MNRICELTRYALRMLRDHEFRRGQLVARGVRRRVDNEFKVFKSTYGAGLHGAFGGPSGAAKRALIVSPGSPFFVTAETWLLMTLRKAGYDSTVLMPEAAGSDAFYHLGGARVIHWEDELPVAEPVPALKLLNGVEDMDGLLRIEHEHIRCGRFAASTSLRDLRVGRLDLSERVVKDRVTRGLATSLQHAVAVQRMLDHCKPDVVILVDRGYTPLGEMFDAALGRHIPCVTWNVAHRGSTLMFKRYTTANRDVHPASLSAKSWQFVQTMPWTVGRSDRIKAEVLDAYRSGEWYSEVGTQFGRRALAAEVARRELGLDSKRKTAVIFPHILWDGTFFWGEDLFPSYEAWLVEAVRAAARNPNVNWIVKIHPANLVKDAREGLTGEPSEVIALRKHLGPLPDHIRLLPADHSISTASLYAVTDYCLTVRGTVGIEAALFGIPVFTAGTGRFDRLGFTVDSASRTEYLDRLAHIQEIEPMTERQRELAERFAYGVFLMRPLWLTSLGISFRRDAKATIAYDLKPRSTTEWESAKDLAELAAWIAEEDEDYLEDSGCC